LGVIIVYLSERLELLINKKSSITIG